MIPDSTDRNDKEDKILTMDAVQGEVLPGTLHCIVPVSYTHLEVIINCLLS